MRHFAIRVNRPPDFVVPKTFGMSAILGIVTALAVLFGFMRWLDAWPVLYFFFAVEAIVICIAQMVYGKAPRVASMLAGVVILPLFTIVAATFMHSQDPVGLVLFVVIGSVPCGALLGYLTGTCAAGIFLVMDALETYLKKRSPRASSR